MTDVWIYCRVVQVQEKTITLDCLIDENTIERRIFDGEVVFDGVNYVGNFIKLHIMSGPGWSQMDVHQVQFSEMYKVAKLINDNG